ncbi:hypothetical protein BC830DRAFT_1081609 [Chytriomyces sp. MP71]|nr:hypothetical protein BC830DRAFT_1081609 [Chytriomyces sp. MP71]
MHGYQVHTPSAVPPSDIYFKPMIPPSAPASHAIVTPTESPVKHHSNFSTKFLPLTPDSIPIAEEGSHEEKRRITAAGQKAPIYSLSTENQAAASAAGGGGRRKRELQQECGDFDVINQFLPKKDASSSPGIPFSVGTPNPSSQHLKKSRPKQKSNVTALPYKCLMEHPSRIQIRRKRRLKQG